MVSNPEINPTSKQHLGVPMHIGPGQPSGMYPAKRREQYTQSVPNGSEPIMALWTASRNNLEPIWRTDSRWVPRIYIEYRV